jgi:hypothetical protein
LVLDIFNSHGPSRGVIVRSCHPVRQAFFAAREVPA